LLTPHVPLLIQHEVQAPAQFADLYVAGPPRDPTAMVRMLGTLGRMTLQPTLLEPFSDTLTLDEARACQRKQLTVHHVLELETKTRGPFPWLWMLSVGQPSTVIREWRLRQTPRWPRGVYRSSEGLAVGVVVLRELPRAPETLTLRLFGDDRIRKQVEAEVAALPEGSPYRLGVRDVFRIWALWLTGGKRRKDMDFGAMNQIIQEEEQRRARANVAKGEQRALKRVLARHGLTPAQVAQIDACTDLETLERWLDQSVTAATADEALR
jgi:hypothetical protein